MRHALLVDGVRLPQVQEAGDGLRQMRQKTAHPYVVVAYLARLAVPLALLDYLQTAGVCSQVRP